MALKATTKSLVLHFHDLRHEGCTRLSEKGMTIPQIQQVSLHDSWSSLERYVSVKVRKNIMDVEQVICYGQTTIMQDYL